MSAQGGDGGGNGSGGVHGEVVFAADPSAAGVRVNVSLVGLAPDTRYALSVHEFGDLRDSRGVLLGGHWNPSRAPHGCPPNNPSDGRPPNEMQAHWGDLGNVHSDSAGNVNAPLFVVSTDMTLVDTRSPGFILGRGVVLNAGPDDCTSQPAGNAGERIATGVIAFANYRLSNHLSTPSQSPQIGVDRLDAVAYYPSLIGTIELANVRLSDGSVDSLKLRVNLTNLLPYTSYRIALYPFGGQPLSSTTPELCNNTLATITASADGGVRCVFPTMSDNATKSIDRFLGMGLAIMSDKSCESLPLVGIAPIGAMPTAGSLFGSGLPICTASTSALYSDFGASFSVPGLPAAVAVVFTVVVLAVVVIFSFCKVSDGYKAMPQEESNPCDEKDSLILGH
ncbi:hypothetical protein HDU84_001399 [Entophlyctis sp. JEL0112]|nr:hypothetical protein HDU84_001399 [Entophlyctis sp. JEL0112]